MEVDVRYSTRHGVDRENASSAAKNGGVSDLFQVKLRRGLYSGTQHLSVLGHSIKDFDMTIEDLLHRCQLGDRQAENELIADYFMKLAETAQRRISGKFQGKFDGEDIAVSVLKSVALRMRTGKVEVEDEKRFWALLVAVMKNKVNRQIEYWTALGRDVHREKTNSNETEENAEPLVVLEGTSREPSPEDAVATSEFLESLFKKLDDLTLDRYNEPSCSEVLSARLEGKEYAEICDDVQRKYGRRISTKSIYHRMKAAEEILETFMPGGPAFEV